MPRKKNDTVVEPIGNGSVSVNDILFAKNLLSTLTKKPYVDFFQKFLYDDFCKIFDKGTVDYHLAINAKMITNYNFDKLRKEIIRFCQTFVPDKLIVVTEMMYKNEKVFRVSNDLQHITGTLLLDEEYLSELKQYNNFIKSFIGKDMYKRSAIHILTAPPAGGKSLFIMQEALFQALRGHNVMLFIIGDMDQYAVLSRMKNILDYYNANSSEYNKNLNRLRIYVYPYGSLNSFDIVNEILRFEETHEERVDFVFIDYDDNLADFSDDESKSMYISAARPYQVLDEYKDGRVIVFAAQGKPHTWAKDIHTSTGIIATSSKKEQIADAIYVINTTKMPQKSKDKKSPETIHIVKQLTIVKDRHNIMNGEKHVCYMNNKNGVFVVTTEE
jgi:hypothetical protein